MATEYGTTLDTVSEMRVSRWKSFSVASALPANTKSRCPDLVCTRRHNLRMFQNKGAVLVLLLAFCGFSVFHFLLDEEFNYNRRRPLLTLQISPLVVVIMCLLVYPVFGWLADVCWERYKVIKWSLRIIFIELLVISLVSAFDLKFSWSTLHQVSGFILHVLIALSQGGFQASIIQFGVDQLSDASSTEITSFICWYVWVWFLSSIIAKISQFCSCPIYGALAFVIFPALVALAICLDMLCNHWLVKEKTSRNPLTLIFKVLRYAAKNKYPRLRNAFSYWDDRQYSRIDLAKTKFGGPFTTEQVEDVKAFFRMIVVIALGMSFVGLSIAMYPVYDKMSYQLKNTVYKEDANCEHLNEYLGACFLRNALLLSGSLVVVIMLPLYECFLHSHFARFFQLSILGRAVVGFLLQLLSLASCSVIEFVAQRKSWELGTEVSDACPLNMSVHDMAKNTLPLDYKWMSISISLNQFAQFVFLTTTAEFLCAQSPYSMKGLLFGLTYGFLGFFTIIGYFLMLPIRSLSEKTMPRRYGCVFWYTIFGFGILLAVCVLVFVAVKCYKRRSRDHASDSDDEE